ncbi:MAG: hypothetical protein CBC24_03355 [Candidatus Pelagibacter sp. TMED64]|nr:hypothetical protein [Candidatus Pelagibacter sp.]OUU66379.1 MAG: hypothetical protein CBC24_03355 [Candidatus Pelagibacter sp. TMED64]|tara:strand:+ start:4054 stop:5301 length:1248 start_codon:yes stop_codon:yes gene_type:complete
MNKDFKVIKSCRICNSKKILNILNLGNHPLANELNAFKNQKSKKYPLKLVFCSSCKTIQISATVDQKKLFNKYVWTTGTSSHANEFSLNFATKVLNKCKVQKPFVVEIASNDGTFLKPFKKKKFKILGVEPASNICTIARKQGIKTIKEFFNKKTANKISKQYGQADIIFARNVIPHSSMIHSIIDGINSLLSIKKGIVAIEFHYAKNILEGLQYDSIYHEHLFYFTAKTLINLLEKYGLNCFDCEKSPISGGALILFFSKDIKNRKSKKLNILLKKENDIKLNQFETWKKFKIQALIHRKKFNKLIKEMSKKEKIIAYGASARSSTLLNFSNIDNKNVKFIIDKSKLKHNKFSPGSNIPIVSFDKIKDLIVASKKILILSWNFKKEIIKDLRLKRFKGQIITPLPNKIKEYEIY